MQLPQVHDPLAREPRSHGDPREGRPFGRTGAVVGGVTIDPLQADVRSPHLALVGTPRLA